MCVPSVASSLRSAICILWLLTGSSLSAQQPGSDMLGENLFPPELLMNYQSEIGLTDEQREALMTVLQQMQPQFEEKQQQLQKEVEKLGAVLKKERIDLETALGQIDMVLNLEREIKRAHLAMVIGMKNKLSAEQQTKLQEIKKQAALGRPPAPFQARMEAKMEKVKAGVEKWQNDGRDPSLIGEMMQELEPLMKAGKLKEAEALLDKALRLLGGPEKEKGGAPEKKRSDAAAPNFHAQAKAPQNPAELEAEIEGLKDTNVAWRGIEWKSCLLEGLKESREKHKPILLWVFIDRPADDQRC